MSRVRFGIQTTLVITAIFLVSWPEFRPSRAATVWRFSPDELQRAAESESAAYQFSNEERRGPRAAGPVEFSATAAANAAEELRRRRAESPEQRVVIPIEVTEAGGSLNAILGRARTSLNTPIPYARLILRNIRTGAIEGRTTANEEGRYVFVDVEASAYVVELLGPDGTVAAASELVSLAVGDVRETTVRVAASAFAMAAQFGARLSGALPDNNANGAGNNLVDQLTNVSRTADPRTDVPNASPL
jgi:hypothetical protein